MTADADRAVLDEAWGHIQQSRGTAVGLGSFTRQRIERIIAIAVGIGSLALGTQAFIASLAPGDELQGWHGPLVIATFVPLAAMILACFVGRGIRVSAGIFAIVYLLALAVWPIATVGSTPDPTSQPWIWYLVSIATLAAILAFPVPYQIAWTVLAPVLFGFVRLVQGGFGREFWFSLGLDVSFALILGGMLLALGWLFRSVALNVDETRARAVNSYADAAAAAASEQERFAVAALMHDSVLAALIAAERASSPRERTLAVGMAREALTRLANAEQDAGEGSDEPRAVRVIADDIEHNVVDFGVELSVDRRIEADTPAVPGRVARSLVRASTQAIANALQHAGGAGLAVSVHGTAEPAGIRIVVRDSGEGFQLENVPADRLGIRGSIVARVAAVGGTAQIVSGSTGTTVKIEWKHQDT